MFTLKNPGVTVAAAMLAAGLTVSTATAATGITVNVDLPDTVNAGTASLGSGHYSITEVPVNGAESLFVFRDDNGDTAAVMPAMKTAGRSHGDKTEVILSPDEQGILHLDKMFIEGQMTGYRFIELYR